MTPKDRHLFEIAEKTFKEIQSLFPNLTMTLDYSQETYHLSLEIPKQTNLDFNINLNLQNQDELHICTDYIWCQYFPADSDKVLNVFLDSVVGIISGQYRILQFMENNNNVYRSYLQKPNGKKWKTICKTFQGIRFLWPWELIKVNTIQNNMNSKLIPTYKASC